MLRRAHLVRQQELFAQVEPADEDRSRDLYLGLGLFGRVASRLLKLLKELGRQVCGEGWLQRYMHRASLLEASIHGRIVPKTFLQRACS